MVLAVALDLSWPCVNRSPYPALARSTAVSAGSALPDPVLCLDAETGHSCLYLFYFDLFLLCQLESSALSTNMNSSLFVGSSGTFFSCLHPLSHHFSRETHQAISHLDFPSICWTTSASVATSGVFFQGSLGDQASLEKHWVMGCLYQGVCRMVDGSMGGGLSCPQNSHMEASEPKWLADSAFGPLCPVLNQPLIHQVKMPCSCLINSSLFSSITLKNIMSHNGGESFNN